MIKTKDQVVSLLQENKNEFKKFGVKRLGIFGSFAQNSPGDKSDLDLLVEFDDGQKNYKNFMSTVGTAERLFEREIDLVTPEGLSSHIAPNIKNNIHYVQIS